MRRLHLVLPGERPTSWNKFYAGMHWTERKAEADRVHWLVKAALLEQGISGPMETPVRILVASYASRPLDASNVPVKLYEDGLVRAGLLPDDGPQYVREVAAQTRKCKKDARRVEILVESIDA